MQERHCWWSACDMNNEQEPRRHWQMDEFMRNFFSGNQIPDSSPLGHPTALKEEHFSTHSVPSYNHNSPSYALLWGSCIKALCTAWTSWSIHHTLEIHGSCDKKQVTGWNCMNECWFFHSSNAYFRYFPTNKNQGRVSLFGMCLWVHREVSVRFFSIVLVKTCIVGHLNENENSM